MEELLKAIETALASKGLSEAAASRLAVGNPSAIKNLRVRRGASRAHPIENLMAVARVLGLELYLGPPRAQPRAPQMRGLAEPAAPMLPSAADPLSSGFVVLPWHPLVDRPGFSPMAFHRSFLAGLGPAPDNLHLVQEDPGAAVQGRPPWRWCAIPPIRPQRPRPMPIGWAGRSGLAGCSSSAPRCCCRPSPRGQSRSCCASPTPP